MFKRPYSLPRRIIIILAVCLLAIALSSCASKQSKNEETKIVNVWIDFSPYESINDGRVHTILQEPFAWQDKEKTVPAPRIKYKVQEDVYVYADEWQDGKYYYEFECAASLKELYIQAPTVEITQPMNEFSVPAIEGETVTRDGLPWFTIDEVRATAGELVISFFIEDSHPTVLPFVDGIVAEGSVSTSEKTEKGYSYQIRVPYIDGKEIVADDVFLCVAQIETIIAIDASYTSDSDVELIPIRD